MPGFLLNVSSMVKCAHGGMATPTATFPRVLVGGQPAVLISAPYQVAACALPPPPAGNGPCVTGVFSIAATRVLANGFPVLLQDSKALCAPTGTPLLVALTQTRVLGT
ncbi:MAG: hypothetical protein JO121_24790 [Deltaproteobacteria bacterium]|jgi:hypothetical protein|nr:hypothetical protein [Deltaproteobacteria bacterium]